MRRKFFWFDIGLFLLGIGAVLTHHLPRRESGLVSGIELGLLILVLLVNGASILIQVFSTAYRRYQLRKNSLSAVFFVLFVFLILLKYLASASTAGIASDILPILIIIRSIVLLFEMSIKLKKIDVFMQELFSHPARTILISFLLVILLGMVLLQLPFSTIDGKGLQFIDALFTSTSAVCVTGLIVVDTATVFTLFGELVILTLIQIGGLSIIILSFFVVFVIRKRVSIESKLLISYVLSQDDVSSISHSIKRIIVITFAFEIGGALLLFFRFIGEFGVFGKALLFSFFHAISAFCNAGFALFTNSLENYAADPYVTVVVAVLIIAGGLSFIVFSNVFDSVRDRIKKAGAKGRGFVRKIMPNTKIVLGVSALLIVSGMLLFYALEHRNSLVSYNTGTQYLAAFFQSVTLRTAGFNTVPFSVFSTTTLLVMMFYMFIGGASGSTAGGIKVNTAAIIFVWIRASIRRDQNVVIFKNTVKKEIVMRSMMIFLFGFVTVVTGTIILSLTENAPLQNILFEAVSAFGTVGLSTGITGALTFIGKIVIIVMMFIGRTGPLTILAAMNEREQKIHYEYPSQDILIG